MYCQLQYLNEGIKKKKFAAVINSVNFEIAALLTKQKNIQCAYLKLKFQNNFGSTLLMSLEYVKGFIHAENS